MNKQRLKAKIIKYFLQSCGSLSIIIVLLIFLFLFKEAFPFIGSPGIGELFHNIWNPVSFQKEEFGLVPLITGSILVTLLATIFAIPFGIIGAVYISEVATAKEREFLKPFIEILAGIPSVVLGFFGLVVIAPLIKQLFDLNTGLTALTGAVLLAFMAIPTIMSISEDAIKSVPSAYKEASLALGASKLETIWKVVVPAALSGIVASVMLGMGRVVGETMTVMMVTGNAPVISMNPFSSVRTMTATIAAEMGEVTIGSHHYMALFWVGIVLMLMTFILNLISYRVLKKYGMIDK
ncbi:MAG TPA: phosphate ABC transporter permease subunit PstC [Ignavibacteria bacterium]|nr:phosphate ABC transporter permease subunit PstC [Bacteroidota bacterium]HRE11084.1 phosphate ABC transporter permease subunit PstC [Ignavibacteria bacterium]HRF64927.1 phosphate ABC transporter permease subunit PstC [Ignavibacteria bacterium]HRJ05324.1 phosphate ABC transporter permease subunit PstC [Ignavibacteria bacterium]HRJ85373.1 phosphate ABC transporter permease subunit PstC [Ignavibacteria bacterium]